MAVTATQCHMTFAVSRLCKPCACVRGVRVLRGGAARLLYGSMERPAWRMMARGEHR